jgi:hypothetical protein
MPSISLINWQTRRTRALDEIESARNSVRGAGRGGQYATQQINRAYVVLLSSEFQGFCRDLHSEAVEHLARTISPSSFASILKAEFTIHRRLDNQNPTPATIGADFNRLGLTFWEIVMKRSPRNKKRKDALDIMNKWRNAIAHQDFDLNELGGTTVHISFVRYWRRICNDLALEFDLVLKEHLTTLTGQIPWQYFYNKDL